MIRTQRTCKPYEQNKRNKFPLHGDKNSSFFSRFEYPNDGKFCFYSQVSHFCVLLIYCRWKILPSPRSINCLNQSYFLSSRKRIHSSLYSLILWTTNSGILKKKVLPPNDFYSRISSLVASPFGVVMKNSNDRRVNGCRKGKRRRKFKSSWIAGRYKKKWLLVRFLPQNTVTSTRNDCLTFFFFCF